MYHKIHCIQSGIVIKLSKIRNKQPRPSAENTAQEAEVCQDQV